MKNHLGEPMQTTFAGWRAACKRKADKLNCTLLIEGDKDIASGFVVLSSFRVAIGEWDGAEGCIYNT